MNSMENPKTINIHCLPNEMVESIIREVPHTERAAVREVSKLWKNIADHKSMRHPEQALLEDSLTRFNTELEGEVMHNVGRAYAAQGILRGMSMGCVHGSTPTIYRCPHCDPASVTYTTDDRSQGTDPKDSKWFIRTLGRESDGLVGLHLIREVEELRIEVNCNRRRIDTTFNTTRLDVNVREQVKHPSASVVYVIEKVPAGLLRFGEGAALQVPAVIPKVFDQSITLKIRYADSWEPHEYDIRPNDMLRETPVYADILEIQVLLRPKRRHLYEEILKDMTHSQ